MNYRGQKESEAKSASTRVILCLRRRFAHNFKLSISECFSFCIYEYMHRTSHIINGYEYLIIILK